MPSGAEDWWSVMRNYAPLQPYFKYFNITDAGAGSKMRKMHDSWVGLLIQDDPRYPPCAISGRKSDLIPSCALEFFRREYPQVESVNEVSKKPETVFQPDPSVNMGLSIIPTAYAEPEPVSLPSVYGGQYVPGVEPEFGLCPTHVRIIAIGSGIVAYDGIASCDTIRRYTEDPGYSVVYPPFPQPVIEQVSIPNVFVETYPTPVTEPVQVPVPEPVTVPVPEPVTVPVPEPVTVPVPEPEPISLPSVYGGQYVPGVEPVEIPEPVTVPVPEPVTVPVPEPVTVPVPEPVTVPVPEPVITEPFKPGKFNTNILVGLLAGGVLAVPILDDLLKTKKKRRR